LQEGSGLSELGESGSGENLAAGRPEGVEPADGAGAVSAAPDEFEAMRRERDEHRDRLLRTAAEFDNYRKRVERERHELGEHATRTLLAALLPILDDFERALRADAGEDPDGYRRGVELIYRQLLNLLASRGVKPIEAVGAPFDPRFHEAVLHVESPGRENGEVIEELRRGYTMGERLLRPALVKVAKA
jgi:molecular chaperone GrpE